MSGIKKAALRLVGKYKKDYGYQTFTVKNAGALTDFWLYSAGYKDGAVNQRLAYQLSAQNQLDMASKTGFVQQSEGVDDTAHLISSCLDFDESYGAVSDDERMFLARMLASYAVREGAWERSAEFDQNAGLHIVVIDKAFPGYMAKMMAVIVNGHREILNFEDIDHVVMTACAD